ncbi:hypothetical protein POVWA2_075730 [Plasmodium ovale wallikeri]|uniref:Uncharacterized protein n=1 Tax=Plasmodium ovale wallikeri TaxID=864142 RepID=A0A1A8YLX8_PLAOA|nr:hypothetical protein POVWA1_012570 [Plasmodium ovale wallikeri]SBT56860.1 hypothetical protein POVWA2_075730 [Plasmodium ovale wallikeri]
MDENEVCAKKDVSLDILLRKRRVLNVFQNVTPLYCTHFKKRQKRDCCKPPSLLTRHGHIVAQLYYCCKDWAISSACSLSRKKEDAMERKQSFEESQMGLRSNDVRLGEGNAKERKQI